MQKLQLKTIKLQAKIITPIHIDNWEVLDRIDYFYFDGFDEIQVLDRKWLVFCAKKDNELFTKIINSIENRDFKELEDLKKIFYNNYIEDFINKYWIKGEIKIWEQAKKSLLQTWNRNNLWEIKSFSRFWIDKELFIPGSTLKGLFRSISLFSKISEVNSYSREKKEKYLENLNSWDAFKETFSFLGFEDININSLNNNLEIQEVSSKNKPLKLWMPLRKWINQVMEVITNGQFIININDLNSKISNEKLNEMLKKYSNKLISREWQILDNIWFRRNFIDQLEDYYKNWYFPIKIWMFKKSLAYKLFWEEMIEELNEDFSWKERLKEAQKKWIWDKMIYLDENENPIWWIAIKILDN